MTNPFGKLAENLIAQAEAAITVDENDYERDGVLYCGNCGTRKQVRFSLGGAEVAVKCLCKCKTEERDRQEAEEKQKQEHERIQRLKSQGIQDRAIQNWTFENDDGRNPAMYGQAMKYYSKWPKMYEENIGILLWGDVGTGKTYFAACIANALLDDGVSVLMTNFPKIINALSGFHTEDKNEYVRGLNAYDLLVIDDLGAERHTDTAQEIVFNVIDSRYKSNKPTIITTNLPIDELKAPEDIACGRIYDRILEMCVPIRFEGESRRKAVRQFKRDKAKALFE